MNSEIIIEVKDVFGHCNAGYKVGEKIVLSLPLVDLVQTDRICLGALNSLIPYVRQFSEVGDLPANARSVIHCPDPGPEKGGKGSVIFRIKRKDDIKGKRK